MQLAAQILSAVADADIDVYNSASAHLGGSVRGERANFRRLVLGCIEAKFSTPPPPDAALTELRNDLLDFRSMSDLPRNSRFDPVQTSECGLRKSGLRQRLPELENGKLRFQSF